MYKMKKSTTQKGITLVALIITIIVLLILAVVAIRAVTGDGIIAHTKNAQTEYEKAQIEEEQRLLEYEYQIVSSQNPNIGPIDQYAIEKEIEETYGQDIKLGDYVNYDETKGGNITGLTDVKWRVLGIENGKILLVSETNIVNSLILIGAENYLNDVAIGKLNTICEPYGKGEFATSARSIKVDDINKILGYNPEKLENGLPYGSGEVRQYGNKVTYTLKKDDDGNVIGMNYSWVTTSGEEASGSTTNYTCFLHPDGRVMMSDTEWNNIADKTGLTRVDKIEVESTGYAYHPENNEIKIDSAVYEMLFLNTNSQNSGYWLASPFIYSAEGAAAFALRIVYEGYVRYTGLWYSYRGSATGDFSGCGVRAVVTLESDVKLTKDGTNNGSDVWSLSK